MILCRGIFLTVLCTSVALAGVPLARAQDATSANSQEFPKKLAATPTPRPEKANPGTSLEIFNWGAKSKACSGRRATPTAEEVATPAPEPERKSVKKGTQLPVQSPLKPPVAGLMSLSTAQAIAVRALSPSNPYQAKRAHITGSGVCVMTVNTRERQRHQCDDGGKHGDGILDYVTIHTFQRWRFKPARCRRFGCQSAMNDIMFRFVPERKDEIGESGFAEVIF